MKSPLAKIVFVAVAAALTISACGDDNAASSEGIEPVAAESTDAAPAPEASVDDTISIVGFAVPEAANKAIAEAWKKTPAGEGMSFETSYGASGDQSRAVVDGLEADYVHLSVASDVTRLVDAGLVAEDWNAGPNKGVVSSSIVVFAVRSGNPKNIQTWDDLVQDGVEIVTPNPASSGAARWNALAAWGQVDRRWRDRGRCRGVPHEVLRQRRRAAQQRSRCHNRLPRRDRRCADGLRERSDPRSSAW